MKQQVLTRNGVKLVDMNPRRAIRRHCHMCSDYSWEEVSSCMIRDCELHPFRLGTNFEKDLHSDQRLRAIQRYCKFQCCKGDEQQYRNCDMETCPLFLFRMRKSNSEPIVRTGS